MKEKIYIITLAVLLYASMAYSFYLKDNYIATGIILSIGTIIIYILHLAYSKKDSAVLKKLFELF